MRNRIINGSMVIDQRNAGASVTVGSGNTYTLDRWEASSALASKFSVQQSTTAPLGFINSLLVTSLAATTPGTSDQYSIRQKIEGFNVFDLGWGAVGAQAVTLSFWVRSSLTGTFGGALQSSGFGRSYPFTYAISSANTWEQKNVLISGDTSGTWLSNNGIGIIANFCVGAGATVSGTAGSWSGSDYRSATGATSVVGTNGATFYITGVQLEPGSVATPFERRSYGQELALCQRYYQKIGAYARQTGAATNATAVCVPVPTPVTMRATPSFSGSITQMKSYSGGGVTISSATYSVLAIHDAQAEISIGNLSVTDNNTYWVSFNASSLSAEL
jgi:hypothetical protein